MTKNMNWSRRREVDLIDPKVSLHTKVSKKKETSRDGRENRRKS